MHMLQKALHKIHETKAPNCIRAFGSTVHTFASCRTSTHVGSSTSQRVRIRFAPLRATGYKYMPSFLSVVRRRGFLGYVMIAIAVMGCIMQIRVSIYQVVSMDEVSRELEKRSFLLDNNEWVVMGKNRIRHQGFPRMVYLDGSRHAMNQGRTVEPLGGPCAYCEKEPDQHMRSIDKLHHDECHLMEEWQSIFHPNCNSVHEVPLAVSSSYLNETTDQLEVLTMTGNWRSVWRYRLSHNETVVLKMLHLHRNFTHESFAAHELDARAMDRLTASPYIVTAFGFCGQSVLTEFAETSARAEVKREDWNSGQRLKMGRDLARAIRDIHYGVHGASKLPTISHNDVNLANVVSINGQLQLNDFNIGTMQRWNGTAICKTPVRFPAPLWKSPEENRGVKKGSRVDAAMADVYGLGNLLFQVLTRRQPWTHMEPDGKPTVEEVAIKKEAGLMPSLPYKYANSTKMTFQALYHAAMACYRYDPLKRPTATELADKLGLVLEWKLNETRKSAKEIEDLFAYS